ncbi:50S ribosomal protein L35 [Planctomycetes bacterium Poly30]|uniref:Large ribosomal subunit protein bL35 n=2 Tax=Saltatorellus ferox TaxID=2528018 RepID=A0A518ERP3_9BACT|nr:50S ribosomal protein L35 [Planctomycetes bacterium Poly30]
MYHVRSKDRTVPKMKSKGAVKKRFRMTKSGKLKCSRPKRGHQHAPKDAKHKRNKRKAIIVTGTWAYLLKRMMGGG